MTDCYYYHQGREGTDRFARVIIINVEIAGKGQTSKSSVRVLSANAPNCERLYSPFFFFFSVYENFL